MLPGKLLGVRLVNGSSRCSGTVEVQLGQSWKPTCGVFWDRQAAEAVCHMLGCGGATGEPVQPTLPRPELPQDWAARNASEAQNATRAPVPAVLCSSDEWQLCKVMEHTCTSDQRLAQVTCAGTAGSPCSCPGAPACPSYSIRAYQGPRPAFSHPSLLSPALGTGPRPRPLDFHPTHHNANITGLHTGGL